MRTAAEFLTRAGPARWIGAAVQTTTRSTLLDRMVLARLHRPFTAAPVRFLLWDGTAVGRTASAAVATLVIKNRRVLLGLVADPEMAFGDGYTCGALEVQGDLLALLEAAYRVFPSPPLGTARFEWRRDLKLTRANIHHHYDLGNSFYRLWLDDAMVYTCAYFAEPGQTLEQAQHEKLDYVCRKLRLQRGDRVIEAGCGWGALALHMAQHYRVVVKAYNISHEQVVYAREQAHARGLADRVEFIEDDYRNVQGQCDAFVSVGMVEHVGAGRLRELGAVINRVLDRRKGRGLLHFIGHSSPRELSAWIRRRIFPGAYVPTLAEVAAAVCESWDLALLDAENLRLHYARTLEHWLQRFEASLPEVQARYGDAFTRAWRLYLAGSIAAFRTGSLQLFQLTFAPASSNEIPWTRAPLYQPQVAQT